MHKQLIFIQSEKEEYNKLLQEIVNLTKINKALYNQNMKVIECLLNYTKNDPEVFDFLKKENIIN